MNKLLKSMSCVGLLVVTSVVFAAEAGPQDVGELATTITVGFDKVAKLITAGAFMAGLGFALGAIMKFKQHKDNPTNIPVGTPIALLFIAAALLFLPSILTITGGTIFGKGAGEIGGTKGVDKFGNYQPSS